MALQLAASTGWVRRAAAALLTVAAVAGCGAAGGDTPLPSARPTADVSGPFPVQYVVDGDTIGVQTDRGVERVRLIGVDTPETKKPNTRVQCWGPQATATTRGLLLHQNVWLEHDDVAGNVDVYGRRLAYVWLGDILVNGELIRLGDGRQYAFNEQKYRYRDAFTTAENLARAKRSGLWGACE